MIALLLLLGCPRAPTSTVGDDLPERAEAAGDADPLGLLEASADTPDPSARARALTLLIGSKGAEPWGEEAVADESDWVARAAVEALGAHAGPQSRALLEQVAGDEARDPYLRAFAALRAPGPASAAAMAEALAAEHEPWRQAPLAYAAVRLGDEAARPALDAALLSGELPLDLEFVEELGRSGDPALAPVLQQAQERVEEELVLPVAAARLRLGDAAAEQAFRKALGDADEQRRLEALDYLVDLEHPAATALLRKASASGPDLVTNYADLALAARTGAGAEVFERAYAEPDRELRALAVRFAGEAGDAGLGGRKVARATERVVLAGLADPDGSVRAEAARAVAALRLSSAREPLQGLLSDPAEQVRIEAAGALLSLQ